MLLFFIPSAVRFIQYKKIMGLQVIKIMLVIALRAFTAIDSSILLTHG
ncbi:hypothetical protein ACN6MY_14905 [Peribacillus sp. B-H-3]